MIRGNRKFTPPILAANIVIATALLCGSPAVIAQDAATAPVVQTVAPPPIVASPPAATPTVAPPPMVPTITQTPNAPAATREPVRQRAAAKPAAKAAVRTAPAAAPVSTAPVIEPEVINAPAVEETNAVTATVEDTAPVAPVEQSGVTPIADGTSDDWMMYAGLGAALGLAGLGGMMAARRRRTRVSDEPTTFVPNTATATPIQRPLPVQQTMAPIERFTAPVTPPVARPSFADAHLPPVTDPLFAHRPVMAPITDPLFMHETILPPVTDPMFADTEEYVGSASASAAFDKRRDWQDARTEPRKPLHEFEPAE